jgi:hypothetical protein
VDRIAELVMRSNQLNFTKRRDSKEQILELISDQNCDTGYVTVTDKFGDYGMVGFFAVKDRKCIHFLFSCRTIGQGVEEYVYATLGCPELDIVEPVINHFGKIEAPAWINQKQIAPPNSMSSRNAVDKHFKIIFKGACDLGQMSEYISSDAIYEEFTFVGKRRCNLQEHQVHSTNYLQWHFLSDEQRKELVDTLVFNDDEMFKTRMYEDDVRLIIFSTMIEPNLGIYRNKKTGFKIAFGEFTNPLTDSTKWKELVESTVYTAQNHFTYEWLKWFSEEYEFCGCLTPEEILEHAKLTLSKVSPNASLCYILGPEIAYNGKTSPAYFGREQIYAKINALFREYAQSEPRIMLIDVNNWVKSQKDFTNNINHWQRRIYYHMAECANEYICKLSSVNIKQRSKVYLIRKEIKDKIVITIGIKDTKFYQVLSRIKKYLLL